ncbi:MAG: alpha-ketoglutarate-dependent dioxygenase AlkB [Flavisolibacter sp.]
MNVLSNIELLPKDKDGAKTIHYTLPDADLLYYNQFFSDSESNFFYKELFDQTLWRQSEIKVYGKVHSTPRLMAWYGDPGQTYHFSGKSFDPLAWMPVLEAIKAKVEKELPTAFNSVLLNLYRNGKDSMGWHRDNEKELGQNPIIASISFGATRPFHLRHYYKKDLDKLTIPLTHGSLLIMRGATQHYWEHQIPKTAKPVNPRINLTFRTIKHT